MRKTTKQKTCEERLGEWREYQEGRERQATAGRNYRMHLSLRLIHTEHPCPKCGSEVMEQADHDPDVAHKHKVTCWNEQCEFESEVDG